MQIFFLTGLFFRPAAGQLRLLLPRPSQLHLLLPPPAAPRPLARALGLGRPAPSTRRSPPSSCTAPRVKVLRRCCSTSSMAPPGGGERMENREEERKGSGGAAPGVGATPGANLKDLVSREYYGHKKKVHSVAWNCSGTKLASGSIDHTARVWSIDPHGHSKVKDIELKGHTDSVDQLCWDPNHPDTVATAAADKSIRLWDARSGKCQAVELSGENINITYKPDGTQIAVGNKEDELTILDVRTLKVAKKHKSTYEVNEIAWNKAGDLFFITTGLGHVDVVKDLEFLKPCKLNAHTSGCYCIAMDPLDRYFAVGSADSLVSLWNVKELLCVRTFTKLEWPVRTVSFNHTGEFIAYASEDPFIDIANVETGRSIHQIPCKAAMNSVEWNPKYNLLAYAGDDKNKYGTADEGVFRIFGFETHN